MGDATLNFDDEARKLFRKLGIDPSVRTSLYAPLDVIWKSEGSSAAIYVGNQTAARDAQLLKNHGITHIVNCTDNMPQYHEHDPAFTYSRFNISFWPSRATDAQLLEFVHTCFDFVDAALKTGGSVLVHCLAGAHRAGTTGCLLLMYKGGIGVRESIWAAKAARPIIDPIGRLPELLRRYESARAAQAQPTTATAAAPSDAQGVGTAVSSSVC